MKIRFDAKKFSELVLYIADRCENDRGFGATKLNKLLFFSDFQAYRDLGKPITGATYQKLERGPAPRAMLPTVKLLTADPEPSAILIHRKRMGRVQTRLLALRDANLELFSSAEIDIVDRVIERHFNESAASVSDESHRTVGWRLAAESDNIPYETFWLNNEPSSLDLVNAERLARQLDILQPAL